MEVCPAAASIKGAGVGVAASACGGGSCGEAPDEAAVGSDGGVDAGAGAGGGASETGDGSGCAGGGSSTSVGGDGGAGGLGGASCCVTGGSGIADDGGTRISRVTEGSTASGREGTAFPRPSSRQR